MKKKKEEAVNSELAKINILKYSNSNGLEEHQ